MASSTESTKNKDKSTEKSTAKSTENATPETTPLDDAVAKAILSKISIHRGSITDMKIGAVVNAANNGLWAGAGVCGAIFRAAGHGSLQKECDRIVDALGKVPTGQSVITKGYKLHARHIIHSVGPTVQDCPALASCYRTALDLCIDHNIRSIAFPCISTGIFGFSKQVSFLLFSVLTLNNPFIDLIALNNR